MEMPGEKTFDSVVRHNSVPLRAHSRCHRPGGKRKLFSKLASLICAILELFPFFRLAGIKVRVIGIIDLWDVIKNIGVPWSRRSEPGANFLQILELARLEGGGVRAGVVALKRGIVEADKAACPFSKNAG